jgi:glycine/serine hydroxymethyltransferase
MEAIADFIARALQNVGNEKVLQSVADDVIALCKQFPIGYEELFA